VVAIQSKPCFICGAKVEERDPRHEDALGWACLECAFVSELIDSKTFSKECLGGLGDMGFVAHLHDHKIFWVKKGQTLPWEMTLKRSRQLPEYTKWKKRVYARDKSTCQDCGSKEKIHAHHLKAYAKYPKLRYRVSNGITVCVLCHRKRHSKVKHG